MRLFACLSIYVAVATSLYTGRFSHGNEVSGPEFQSKLIQPILPTRNVSLSNGTHFLSKRGDPNFDEEWWSNDPKKRALEAALIDTRTLVSRVLKRWDEPFAIEIRKRYFPDTDANAVKQVFSNIVRQPNPVSNFPLLYRNKCSLSLLTFTTLSVSRTVHKQDRRIHNIS